MSKRDLYIKARPTSVSISVNGDLEGQIQATEPLDVQLTDGTNPVPPISISLISGVLELEIFDYIPLITDMFVGRVLTDNGTFEAKQCLTDTLRNEFIYNTKLISTPNGYKSGKIYALKPFDGSGDFDMVRATNATRIDSNGLLVAEANDIIRLDYNGGVCPCILVEDIDTNTLLHSEELDNAYWTKTRLNTSGTPAWVDVVVAPDGTQTAEKLIPNTVNATHDVGVNLSMSDTYKVFSCFVKANEYDEIRVLIRGGSAFGNRVAVRYNLTNKEINISETEGFGTFTQFDYKIDELPNGWFRIQVGGFIPATETDILLRVNIISPTGAIFSGNDIDGLYVWGLQLSNDFGSYIPTTTAAVTRNADIATVTPPVGVTEIIETFEDNSVNIITTIPSTYQLPIGRIKHIVMK